MKAILLILLFYSNAIFAGEIIPPFSAMELTTNQLQQFDFSKASTPTVVAFISKDCPCSKGNIPYLKELANQYKQFHFLIIHAKKDTSNLEVSNYLKANQVNFQAINDDKLSITNAFKALKTPHIYIINQKNEIIYNGAVTNSTFPEDASEFYLKNALKDIASNQPIKKNETKTMGCFIVR
jgi:hypothetical protein